MRLLVVLVLAAAAAAAAAPRSKVVRAEFMRMQPCPATGRTYGACPGWVVDHVEPLCSGASDSPSNMQWQTIEAAKAKDRLEMKRCRDLKKER